MWKQVEALQVSSLSQLSLQQELAYKSKVDEVEKHKSVLCDRRIFYLLSEEKIL